MKQMEWHTEDKSGWDEGPWKNEPDKEQWVDEETGLPCLIKRNRLGALCGYVGIDLSHRLYGKHYNECIHPDCSHEDYCDYHKRVEGRLSVHGGLTYSDFCMEGDEAKTICHVPEPGEPEPLWWLGFDCAHSGDYCPHDSLMGYPKRAYESYRDLAYVKSECTSLAKQIAEFAEAPGDDYERNG